MGWDAGAEAQWMVCADSGLKAASIRGDATQIPYGNDKQKNEQRQRQEQEQIQGSLRFGRDDERGGVVWEKLAWG